MIRKIVTILLFICPILAYGYTTTVPKVFNSNNQVLWYKLESRMLNTSDKSITYTWRGFGGDILVGNGFINSVIQAHNQGKIITFNVTGFTASMHANAVCYGDSLNLTDNAELYYHAPFIMQGKTKHYLTSDYREYWMVNAYLKQCINKGLLTEYERQLIMTHHKAIVIHYDRLTNTYTKEVVEDE